MEQLGPHYTNFHEILYLNIFRKSIHKVQILLKSDNITGTLHEDKYTFLIISRSFFLRMRNVSDKISREHRNTHFILNNFFPKDRDVYEITWKNILEPDRSVACWMTKATITHSEYVINIAFPHQQWLYVRASLLYYCALPVLRNFHLSN